MLSCEEKVKKMLSFADLIAKKVDSGEVVHIGCVQDCAECYEKLGHRKKAIKYYKKAINIIDYEKERGVILREKDWERYRILEVKVDELNKD